MPWLTPLFFLGPNLVLFLLFTAVPVVAALGLSFCDWDMVEALRFAGLANYRRLASDPLFRQALWNTIYYTLGVVPVGVTLALVLGLALNRRTAGTGVYRCLYFMPVVTPLIAASLLWGWLYEPEHGLLNYFLGKLGLPTPQWLGDTRTAMPAVILMSLWKNLGYNTVLFLAGLQGIPPEFEEAAIVDGATGWQRVRYVTIPLVSPTTFFVVVMALISSFQVFAQAYMMTRGGPEHATVTLVYYIYTEGFGSWRMGYAAAVSWVLFACVFLVTGVQWLLRKRWVMYE